MARTRATLLAVAVLALAALPLTSSKAASAAARPPSQRSRSNDDDADASPSSGLAHTFATLGNLVPRFTYTAQPETLLKIRKVFRPLMTELVVGGDYDPRLNVWTFRTDWTENVLGGEIGLNGPILQWSKALFFPGIADVATRVKFIANVDLRTFEPRTGMEVSLRRASVFQRGLQLERKVPLDGPNGHFKLGLVGAIDFPETIGLSTGATGLNASEVNIALHLKRVDLLVDF